MQIDEIYINRCLELAQRGKFNTSPNPRVGAVLVHKGKIIGEGYHEKYGEPHAEVKAISSVEDKSLIKASTLYVNLEPCSHHGKTPPCADLIIDSKIPRVVICNTDPFEDVNGSGIARLKENGIEVSVNILAEKGNYVNRRFFTYHRKKRPYIILKWAETKDGFISREKDDPDFFDNWITTQSSKALVHSWRAEENAILIGANTAMLDKPKLNTRLVEGRSPIKLLLDPNLEVDPKFLPKTDNKWMIFNSSEEKKTNDIDYIKIDFDHQPLQQLMNQLYGLKIQSLIVEGGQHTLNSFITTDLWDEARQFVSPKLFHRGISAPSLQRLVDKTIKVEQDVLNFYYNQSR